MNVFETALWIACAGFVITMFGGYAIGFMIAKVRKWRKRGD